MDSCPPALQWWALWGRHRNFAVALFPFPPARLWQKYQRVLDPALQIASYKSERKRSTSLCFPGAGVHSDAFMV